MRTTYAHKFIQISVYSSPSERQSILVDKIKHFNMSTKDDFECEKMAIELIKQDYNQRDVPNGQRLSDVFHLADVFFNGLNSTSSHPTIDRFIDAFFGCTIYHLSVTSTGYTRRLPLPSDRRTSRGKLVRQYLLDRGR